jgi:hypothetical protein
LTSNFAFADDRQPAAGEAGQVKSGSVVVVVDVVVVDVVVVVSRVVVVVDTTKPELKTMSSIATSPS